MQAAGAPGIVGHGQHFKTRGTVGRRLGIVVDVGFQLASGHGAPDVGDSVVHAPDLISAGMGRQPGRLVVKALQGLPQGLSRLALGILGQQHRPLAAGREEFDGIGGRADGMIVALSAPRRDPGALHEAVREAQLLVELAGTPEVAVLGQDETYRLLIGVLLRDPDELAQLRERTISPLAEYDARHDTDLLATLRTFLAHDGSTTETADAMNLHRHTVGYRLARVHEVSGLSPYESDGRERLSLGLKAAQIIEASRISARRDG